MRFCWICLLVLSALGPRCGWAQPLVAETPPLSPAEERTKLHLPPGFEIQLVAEEPQIHKPMNLKFDARGRLWVTHSLEYPFAAKNDEQARDAISVLSDFGPDGKARSVRRFAEHLNIPIGVLPLNDQESLAWSVPNIYRLKDADGDGLAEDKTIVFGPFGVVDLHGDQNAFTRWIDGWVYANHGFNNDSHVKRGGVGEEVLHMNSGNTYRFRADGSAIEQFSWGQVNPFGLSFDPLGDLYSADCHSHAVTMLLREGYYQSFGKPHDGLGFAPETTNIDHGGTGIAGVVYSTAPGFPAEYRDVLFVGNVITNSVHCDRLKWTGSTPWVTKSEPFLTSDDPWFRPVDVQLGPDGALYIADFYNCIIGHYEVPLTHPKRDRERGRIWRIVYTGDKDELDPASTAAAMPDLESLKAREIFALLKHPNLTVRTLATNSLVDRFPSEAAAMSRELLDGGLHSEHGADPRHDSASWQASHAVWIVQRTAGIEEALGRKLLAAGVPALVEVHTVRALGETAEWQPWHFETVRNALENADPFVRRAAAEALAKHPAEQNISPLLKLLGATDKKDAQLYHGVRIAIRDQLRAPEVGDQLLALKLSPAERKQLVEFAASAPAGPAALLVFDEALRGGIADDVLLKALPAAAQYVDGSRVVAMIDFIERRFAADGARQFSLLRALAEGLTHRGLALDEKLRARLTQLIEPIIAGDLHTAWHDIPLAGLQRTASPWAPEQRTCRDGTNSRMISSLRGGGERLGGTLRSPLFEIPPTLSFWMCGHNGRPDQPDRKLNFVRLVLEDGAEVARSYPPRNDVAQRFQWQLAPYAGRHGHLEVVDGMTEDDGFAWLAVARFAPSVLSSPEERVGDADSIRTDVLQLAGRLKLTPLADAIAEVATSGTADVNARLAAAEALLSLEPQRAIAPLAAILADANMPTASRETAAQQLGRIDRQKARTALLAQLKAAPESVAVLIAAGLAGRQDSAESLLKEIREGRAAAGLLQEPSVVDRLKAAGVPELEHQIAELTADLAPTDSRVAKLIAQRREGFLAGNFDPEVGRAVFAKSVCASCHRIGEVGKTIGPALDGIGNRGLDRLLEDTLDPNRNVDVAFRTELIETDAGQILSGFQVREEEKMLVFNDAKGEQVRVPAEEVVSRTQSALSPMPTNVIEQMPEKEYYELLAFLLSLKGK
jgi:putative heme-binding domain-containing protein